MLINLPKMTAACVPRQTVPRYLASWIFVKPACVELDSLKVVDEAV